jgi:hypothetical protein
MDTTFLAVTEASRHANMSTLRTAEVLSAFLHRMSEHQATHYERDILLALSRDVACLGGRHNDNAQMEQPHNGGTTSR